MIAALILACEVGFWVFIVSGLAARYLWRKPRLGAALLLCAPLADVVLLAATAIDLTHGATATVAHSLAAVYIGMSVAFGHQLVRSADVRFAHRYAGGPKPEPRPAAGRARAQREWQRWRRHALAWGIGAGLLVIAVVAVGASDRTEAMLETAAFWTLVLVIDLIVVACVTTWQRGAPGRGSTAVSPRR